LSKNTTLFISLFRKNILPLQGENNSFYFSLGVAQGQDVSGLQPEIKICSPN
jgi:hypothetical protein